MAEHDAGLVPTFSINTFPNEAASKAAGRPIFQEMEVVTIRFAGDRQKVVVFPAHDVDPNATRAAIDSGAIVPGDVITYAQAYGSQYRQFKMANTQEVAGTPLSELPFLSEAKRRELKACNVYTAEALASLDGNPLKMLGMGGREMKDQARAYLDRAAGSADTTAMAAEIAALKQQLADTNNLIEGFASKQQKTKYQKGVERSVAQQVEAEQDEREAADGPAPERPKTEDDERPDHDPSDWTNDELKTWLRDRGLEVRGNPSHDTLVGRVRAAQAETE